MWRKVRSPLLFLSLGMNIAFLVVLGLFAFPGYPIEIPGEHRDESKKETDWKKKHDKDPGWWFYKHEIGVSDTQWQNLRPAMEQFHGQAHEICQRIQQLRNDILKQIESPNPDEESIRANEERILELKQKKQRMFAQYMIDKKQYLTREQQQKFYGKLREHKDCDKHARFLDETETNRD